MLKQGDPLTALVSRIILFVCIKNAGREIFSFCFQFLINFPFQVSISTISNCSKKTPYQSQTTLQDETDICETLYIHAILLKPSEVPYCLNWFSVFCIAMKKQHKQVDIF